MTLLRACLGMLLVAAPACGGAPARPSGPPGAASGHLRVVLAEFSLQADPGSVAAGSVQVEAENVGRIPHELSVIATDLGVDALPVADGRVDEDSVRVVGEIDPIGRATTRSGSFDLEPGAYVLICNVAGHYQAGMRAPLTVTG